MGGVVRTSVANQTSFFFEPSASPCCRTDAFGMAALDATGVQVRPQVLGRQGRLQSEAGPGRHPFIKEVVWRVLRIWEHELTSRNEASGCDGSFKALG